MTPSAFPLTWPAGRIRRGGHKTGQFKYTDAKGWKVPVTIATAVERVQDQVWRLGGRNLLISSNLQVGKTGLPLSNQRKPDDPGAVAYFSLVGAAIALACDTYNDVAQNLAALAAHVEAVRAIERHGVATAEESLRAFEALPSPDGPASEASLFSGCTTAAEITTVYRAAAKARAGNDDALKALNVARDEALKRVKS